MTCLAAEPCVICGIAGDPTPNAILLHASGIEECVCGLDKIGRRGVFEADPNGDFYLLPSSSVSDPACRYERYVGQLRIESYDIADPDCTGEPYDTIYLEIWWWLHYLGTSTNIYCQARSPAWPSGTGYLFRHEGPGAAYGCRSRPDSDPALPSYPQCGTNSYGKNGQVWYEVVT